MALTQVNTLGIADDAVTQDKVANDAIDITEIKSGTDGELITYDASGNPAKVGAGTAGHFLKSQGAGNVPIFAAVPAGGISHDGSTANGVLTYKDADEATVEANLTFDGNNLNQTIDADNEGFKQTAAGNHYIGNIANADITSGAGYAVYIQSGQWDGNQIAQMRFICGDDTTNKDDGDIAFYTSAGGSSSEVLRLTQEKNVEIADGNLKFASGHGIDFSATADAGGMSNELLDDYEEGTWTPALTYGGNAVGLNTPVGTYVKVGNLICCRCRCHTTDNPSGNNVNISGLPYTSSNPANDGNAITGAVYMETCASGITTGHPMAFGFDNSTNFDIRMSGTTGGGTSQVSDAAGTGTSYMTTITYQTS